MHQFPKDPVVRKKWVKFVQRHRADFDESSVTRCASLCSVHFEESILRSALSTKKYTELHSTRQNRWSNGKSLLILEKDEEIPGERSHPHKRFC